GHQMDDVNRFAGWPKPFLHQGAHLERPWGEQFVREFYNHYEEKYPIIDNITSEWVAGGYALANSKAPGLVGALGRFAGFYLFRTTWDQKVDSLGDEQPPAWDIARIRQEPLRFVIDSAAATPELQSAIAAASAGGDLGDPVALLSDIEIIGICDWRW